MDINSLALSGPQDPRLLEALQMAHNSATGMFGMTSKAVQHLTQRYQGLQELYKLGDGVTAEDVIQEAAKLVSSGSSPTEMAAALADMPQGGQALAGWVQQKLATTVQSMQKVQSAHAIARHEMGVSGLRLLAAHAGAGPEIPPPVADKGLATAGAGTPNPLAAQAPAGGSPNAT